MPELPEVETTRRGIAPHLVGRRIESVLVRERRLRWPVPRELERRAAGQEIRDVGRRAKYLLVTTTGGTALVHLGMSGCLSIVDRDTPPRAHDHVDIALDSGRLLRFNDPRRFGTLLWTADPGRHRLLTGLGPEPLSEGFDGDYLHLRARGRRGAIKSFLMNAAIVVGVGNIYASEALHYAGIHPKRRADRVSRARMGALAAAVRQVLEKAIAAGGTTLRDFYGGDGAPGYFRHQLTVYGRAGEPCLRCGEPIRQAVIGQRSSFYCLGCQR